MDQFLQDEEGVNIAYQKIPGESPGVVFLGGFMSDMTGTKALYLEEQCKKWGKAYVRFDYFGHGVSGGEFSKGTIGRWLSDALRVLDTLTEGPQILVGSSMGGWLMLLTALRRSLRVMGLVGIAAAPDFLDDFARLSSEQQKALDENGICYMPSQYGDKPYPISAQLIEEARQHRLLQSEIPVNCPIRLLHGLLDQDVPWQKSVQIAEKVHSKDTQLTLIKSGDHRLSEDHHLKLLGEKVWELMQQ